MHKDAIFSQAALPKKVWELLVQAMDLFEHAKLKGQKLDFSTQFQKPEFKLNYVSPIWSLNEEQQSALLQQVIDGETWIDRIETCIFCTDSSVLSSALCFLFRSVARRVTRSAAVSADLSCYTLLRRLRPWQVACEKKKGGATKESHYQNIPDLWYT